jgi:hypothetical protein
MAELPQGLRLDLADPLAGDVDLLADFLERPCTAVLQPEAELCGSHGIDSESWKEPLIRVVRPIGCVMLPDSVDTVPTPVQVTLPVI